ncbi:MAG: Gfo/Idh/MocA family oxidoreductase [Melioribacteraceae bacterium]|nr:Gfo/Idh/MocA family oxidoreductase [Melioribacteraceae bacterium]MCF8356081.1 Gfo/Idh/MocA family oxidoreductase [Melioribacteraceae bacterium]MCF8395536.1 Gfo/Idh/MocA family oxidoreductase [Melioribacteraceae bacterium]MCF8420608.1 Gfo/Idh/MocA family oxidoreductase [Melioribacteraceae bacterium]
MTFNSINLEIYGAGRWGMNHVKTAASILNPEQITVIDTNPETEQKIKAINSSIEYSNIPKIRLSNKSSIGSSIPSSNDASIPKSQVQGLSNICAIVATPAETHYMVAKDLLNSGRNVLVEKPITLLVEEATELVEIADKNNVKLMVGHVLIYHPAVIKMKEEILSGKIGKLQYIYSNRLNLGAIRSEENSLWSFAPHDISIIQYLVGDNPIQVTANGGDFVQDGIEDTTLTFLTYPGNVKAHIFVSWLHPFKEQRMVVVGDKGMFVFEDSLKTEKLKYYKKGFEIKNGSVEKFDSEYEVVDFDQKMPLNEEHLHFYNSVINDTQPLTDGKHAVEVLRILEKATNSLKD